MKRPLLEGASEFKRMHLAATPHAPTLSPGEAELVSVDMTPDIMLTTLIS